jgi:hypothetical protein
MALIIKDRVKEGTTTSGTGNITLAGSSSTFVPFNSYMTNGDTSYYAIEHTSSGINEWEVGLGTWNTGNTLSRTTVLAGSAGTSAVDFSAGTKNIFMTYPSAIAAFTDGSGDLSSLIGLGNHTTTDVAEGSNLYFTTGRIDSHLSGGTGVTYNAGAISVGQAVATSSDVTFNTVTLGGNPSTALQAATKEYVDTIAAAGIHYHERVRVEAATNRPATYDNGTSGVGATLTNSGTQEVLVIDGVTVNVADRVLITQQTNTAHNGVYTVTNVGSASTNWVLTRATDADSYGPSDKNALGEGDAYFVKEGLTGAGELYVMNTSGVITFGTTPITFTVIAETAIYSAGTGLTLTGTEFATVQDIATGASPIFVTVNANLSGNVTGNVTGNVSGSSGSTTGNAATATKLATARTVQLSGDVTGSASFDGSANINITATVGDDSHAHIISNVDGLQAALDAKADDSTTITAGTGLTGGGTLGVNSTLSLDTTYTDTRYVNATGDTMTGALTATGFSGPLTGNASTATTLATGRTISLTGDVTGTSAAFNGSGNVSIAATIAANSVALGTDTTGNYVAAGSVSGVGLSGSSASEGGTFTVTSNATNLNTVSTIVARNASGNFSAGTITAALSGNATTATTAATTTGNAGSATVLQTARTINGVSFNGSANITVADSTKAPTASPTFTGTVTSPTFNASSTTNGGFQGIDADTALLPSFTWTSDQNTGIWHSAADSIGFTTAGVNRLTLSTTALTSTLNIAAPTFSGSGASLTALNGSNISTGTVAAARVATLNQNTTGSAATLTTARTINGVSFNGSANITVADSTKAPTASPTFTGTVSSPTFNATSVTSGGFQGIDADTIAAPSFTWTSDLDTGMWHSAANQIGFTTGGVNRFTIDASGNVTATGNVTAYSDVRLKSNIQTIESGLDKVCAMRGVTFEKDGVASLGVIAQEVEQVIPEVVFTDADGMKSVAYANLVGVLIEAIKELKLEIEILKGN